MLTEHGSYSVCREEQIIFLKALGPWNEVASASCIHEIDFIVNTMQYDDFAIVVDTLKLDGMTLEAFDLWFDALDFYFEKGNRHFIRVDDNSRIEYTLFSKPFDEISKKRIQFEFSKSIKSGVKALHRQGYKGFDIGITDDDCIKNF